MHRLAKLITIAANLFISDSFPYLTVSITVVEWLSVPLVPVTVMVYCCGGPPK
jgi:hypothetical protein